MLIKAILLELRCKGTNIFASVIDFYALCTQTVIFFDTYQGRFVNFAYLCRQI